MNTPETTTAPVNLDVAASSGSCCNPTLTQEKKGNSTMTQDTANQQNHGCQFDWCTNEMGSCESQRLEHLGPPHYVPATGSALSRPRDKDPYGESLMTVGVGLRYNEDIDVAPSVYVHLYGGWNDEDADAILQLNEAIMLHNALGRSISSALADVRLRPSEVEKHYGVEPEVAAHVQ